MPGFRLGTGLGGWRPAVRGTGAIGALALRTGGALLLKMGGRLLLKG